ncbi:MAG: alpha-E domain-containing protein [Hyphomonas sp.]|nr:alpha-E domain-containing protein [Hyphomonas sp.]
MLGRTAAGLFWMARYLERAENMARLVEAGFRMALTRADSDTEEWRSVITTAGCADSYLEKHETVRAEKVVDFVLRDRGNPGSVLQVLQACRENARMTRTALTREVWEAINDTWMGVKDALKRPVSEQALPEVLTLIRQQGAQVRGAMSGTMLRNDIFDFVQLGTLVERADTTARILDTKYYVLLPSSASIGSSLDNVQWEMILRSASAERSFHWLFGGTVSPLAIADFLIFDPRLPRSLAFCYDGITDYLKRLETEYGASAPSHEMAVRQENLLTALNITRVLETGLHEFLSAFMAQNAAFSAQIETDYRFYE